MAADDFRKLVRQLQGAYSGELAAGYAYRGHWKSLPDGEDRERIRTIESEEWHHRELVGGILRDLGAKPNALREAIFWTIGRTLGLACHVSGWYLPMYGAGWLERKNIVEYEDAAVYAANCGHPELIDCLLTMAEVEWEHERFFREKAASRGLLKLWPAAPAKESIRTAFAAPASAGGKRRIAG